MRFLFAIALLGLAACLDQPPELAAADAHATCLARNGGPCLGDDAQVDDVPSTPDVPPAPPPPVDAKPYDCADYCPTTPLTACADCAIVCPEALLETCAACPDTALFCGETGQICAPAPLCVDVCDIDGGAQVFCEHAQNLCTCLIPSGGTFSCVGPL